MKTIIDSMGLFVCLGFSCRGSPAGVLLPGSPAGVLLPGSPAGVLLPGFSCRDLLPGFSCRDTNNFIYSVNKKDWQKDFYLLVNKNGGVKVKSLPRLVASGLFNISYGLYQPGLCIRFGMPDKQLIVIPSDHWFFIVNGLVGIGLVGIGLVVWPIKAKLCLKNDNQEITGK